MLTDPSYAEEFDTIVDELTDQYVNDELTDDERQRVEKYFLNTPERQQKLEFATELLSHAEAERGERLERSTVVEREPSWLEQFRAFWRKQSFAYAALTAVALIVVAGVTFSVLQTGNRAAYTVVNPPLSTSNRAEGSTPLRLKLPESGLKINLAVPQDASNAKDFRVRLLDGSGAIRDLTIDERKDQTITVSVPASSLTRGSYAIQLFEVKADGTEQRVRGSYRFDLE